jgi:hypothetical protein
MPRDKIVILKCILLHLVHIPFLKIHHVRHMCVVKESVLNSHCFKWIFYPLIVSLRNTFLCGGITPFDFNLMLVSPALSYILVKNEEIPQRLLPLPFPNVAKFSFTFMVIKGTEKPLGLKGYVCCFKLLGKCSENTCHLYYLLVLHYFVILQ